MSSHGKHHYENTVGMTFRDKCITQFDLSVEDIENYVNHKKTLLSATLWDRYAYRGKRRTLNFLQRAYANVLLAWTLTA